MTIVYLDWETAHLHGEAWISHHQLRHRLFVEHRAWRLPTYAGLRRIRSVRHAGGKIHSLARRARQGARRHSAYPDNHAIYGGETWPELLDGDAPKAPEIWQASRFCCDRGFDRAIRRRIVAELICGCQEFGLANRIDRYLDVMRVADFRTSLEAAGCSVRLIEASRSAARYDFRAAYPQKRNYQPSEVAVW